MKIKNAILIGIDVESGDTIEFRFEDVVSIYDYTKIDKDGYRFIETDSIEVKGVDFE